MDNIIIMFSLFELSNQNLSLYIISCFLVL